PRAARGPPPRGGPGCSPRREVRDAMLQLRAAARSVGNEPVPQLVRDILANLGYTADPPSGGGATREKWESLAALVALADELHANRTLDPDSIFTLADFTAELEERAAAQHAPKVQGVTLASLHSAKGLEWDAVFLVGLSEGLMPISFADTPEAVDEERRLLYVGITRARVHLSLSWSTARTPGGRANRKPSRFLDGLRPNTARDAGSPRQVRPARKKVTGPAKCRVCGSLLTTGAERKMGRCGDCPSTYDETTFEALREWRREAASEAGVPAFVVFTDATLVAIAEDKPPTLNRLATIPGVGPSKLERYGEAVLQVLAQSPQL
ncbi:3'-5' exonuclease, partial [Arthrobacter sp. 3Tela_A]|uniref:3'-5' exonuclease n=1 Tax=Arthrobacter sp. 3Tela_A TaxID=3093743 RepID=UPI003BB6B4DA